MNKSRRKEIAAVVAILDGALADAQTILDGEQGDFEELSEKAQESEKGEERQAAINALEEAVSSIESAMQSLQEAGGE